MRELPNLRRLLDGTASGVSVTEGGKWYAARCGWCRGIQNSSIADRLAADPRHLSAQLDRADAAQGQGELDAFFHEGETRFGADAFTTVLRELDRRNLGERRERAEVLSFSYARSRRPTARAGCLRLTRRILEGLGRPEPAPAMPEVLAPLVAAGLVEKCP